jgi:uncharacterized damage-inducible protein DinB
MPNATMLIAELSKYSQFLLGLRDVDPGLFASEIAPGKWSIQDLISHIMMWDRNFVEKTGPRLLAGTPVSLEEDMDPQAFNDRAAAYGRKLNHHTLLDEAFHYRSELLSQLSQLPTDTFEKPSRANDRMSLATFLQQMFISHDEHHITQMKTYLVRHGVRLHGK